MQWQIGKDLYGRPYIMKATRAQLVNGVIMNTGNTEDMNNEVYHDFLNMIHGLVPWNYQPQRYPQTIWRSILLLVIVYLRCLADGELTEVWNADFHHSSVPINGWSVVDENTDANFVEYYNLRMGAKYWKSPVQLMLVLTGDGFGIPKSPEDIKNGSVGLVKVHAIKHDNIHQSLYVGVPFFISGLSHYNPIITEIYHMCSQQLGTRGGLSFKCNSNDVNICIDWFRYDNGDWPWLSTVVHRCYPYGADYSFIYWIRHIGKEWVAVKNTIPNVLDAIKAGIKDEHMPWNLTLDNITDSDNFYCLTTNNHWQKWCDDIETYMTNLDNIDNLTRKQQHSKRKTFAHAQAQCALYSVPTPLIQWILDVMHLILRHSINTLN